MFPAFLVLRSAIFLLPHDETPLTPFAGSGSSLMAAKMLGRSYIGIELDANYHGIAKKRLKAFAERA